MASPFGSSVFCLWIRSLTLYYMVLNQISKFGQLSSDLITVCICLHVICTIGPVPSSHHAIFSSAAVRSTSDNFSGLDCIFISTRLSCFIRTHDDAVQPGPRK
eukprot:TRINITY_DN14809_c0_g2_i1.p1 TRINITY_DN14809_c0_g2~~TRINITY_DN14809_c0_g2_i1.p1  ORF type:complete len:103 (-),score=5.37 TRINITY_DN14809_c0_g2_i1:188-496(-)